MIRIPRNKRKKKRVCFRTGWPSWREQRQTGWTFQSVNQTTSLETHRFVFMLSHDSSKIAESPFKHICKITDGFQATNLHEYISLVFWTHLQLVRIFVCHASTSSRTKVLVPKLEIWLFCELLPCTLIFSFYQCRLIMLSPRFWSAHAYTLHINDIDANLTVLWRKSPSIGLVQSCTMDFDISRGCPLPTNPRWRRLVIWCNVSRSKLLKTIVERFCVSNMDNAIRLVWKKLEEDTDTYICVTSCCIRVCAIYVFIWN